MFIVADDTIIKNMSRSSDNLEASAASRERVVRKRATAVRVRSDSVRRTRALRGAEKSPKKTVDEAVTQNDVEERVQTETEEKRKAPTKIAETKVVALHKRKQVIVTGSVLLFGIFASAMIGFTDDGQIDVQKTIEERNERIRNNQANNDDLISGMVEVPVQNTSVKADGGLIGRGVGSGTTAPPLHEADSATSSLDVATSSEAVSTTTEPLSTDDVPEEELETSESADE